MSLWSDQDIADGIETGQIEIDPYDPDHLQPASIDLRLSDEDMLVWSRTTVTNDGIDTPRFGHDDRYTIVPWMDQAFKMRPMKRVPMLPSGVLVWSLPPQGFALAATVERVGLDPTVAGRLEGKSSLARLGLMVHVTAGFFDPGFRGYPTLELFNATRHPIVLRAGMPIAQMSFFDLHTRSRAPYGFATGSKYQDQGGAPQPSRYYRNFKPEPSPNRPSTRNLH